MTDTAPHMDHYGRLAARLGVPAPVLAAVCEVESSGRGFLPVPSRSPGGLDVSGFPVVRFEAHVFWWELKAAGIDPAGVIPPRPDILSPALNMKLVKTREGEWDRLEAARTVHADAATRSASWGAFQIMGFNAGACGASGLAEFVGLMGSAEGQAELFAGFLSSNPLMLRALKGRDWAAFARLYNGKLYAANGYDRKLKAAWERQARAYGL
jgi:hypothetical protein